MSDFVRRAIRFREENAKEHELRAGALYLQEIKNYKGSGTPWLLLKCLMEGDSCSLITQKQLFDFVRGVNRD